MITVNRNASAGEREAFPLLQDRIDAQGLDGWWLPCMHHLFRDVLRYHHAASPLHVLFRPLHLVFFVDKNSYPWLWDGPEEEFLHPEFNQGVNGHWQVEYRVEEACQSIQKCLDEGRIPLIHLEWFHVPFATQYGKMRGNLHAVAVLDYHQENEALYIVDRTALPASHGGFEKDRGWVPVASLRSAILEDFGWFDYHLEKTMVTWQVELRTLLLKSAFLMREGHQLSTSSSDHGLQAMRGFTYFIQSLTEAEIATKRCRTILYWHLPPCIRKFIVGQRQVLNLVLIELGEQYSDLVAQVQVPLQETIVLWNRVASSLFRLGFEQEIKYRLVIGELIAQLTEQEEALGHALERLAFVL